MAYSENVTVDPDLEHEERSVLDEYRQKLVFKGTVLPDPLGTKEDWNGEAKSIAQWPSVYYHDISNYLKLLGPIFIAKFDREYKLGKAYRYFTDELVREIYYHPISDNSPCCMLRCRCIHSQSMNLKPYQVWAIIRKDQGEDCPGGDIISAYCSCTAGLGGMCNHVVGFLFRIENAVTTGVTKPSKTSKLCNWNVPSGTKVRLDATLSRDMVFHKHHYTKVSSRDLAEEKKEYLAFSASLYEEHLQQLKNEDELRKSLYESLKAEIPTARISEIMEHKRLTTKEKPIFDLPLSMLMAKTKFIYNKNKTMPDNISDYIDMISPSSTQIKNLQVATSKQAQTEEWNEHRVGRITASNFYRVCTRVETLKLKPSDNVDSLKNLLLGKSNFPTTKAMKHGIALEPHAKKKNVSEVKRKHKGFTWNNIGLVIFKSTPYIGASPDLEINCECCGHGLVEIKCPYSICDDVPSSTNLTYLRDKESDFDVTTSLTERSAYFYQIQGQMAVTNTKYCDFFVYTKFGFHLERIEFKVALWNDILEKLQWFWLKFIAPELIHAEKINVNNCVNDEVHFAVSQLHLQEKQDHEIEKFENVVTQPKDIKLSETIKKRAATTPSNKKPIKRKRKALKSNPVYLCGVCGVELDVNPINFHQQSIGCDACPVWFHFVCVGINKSNIPQTKNKWFCPKCNQKNQNITF